MILCQKTKFDQKNRVLIPKDILIAAGGSFNCEAYVVHVEGTNEVKLVFQERSVENEDCKEARNIYS